MSVISENVQFFQLDRSMKVQTHPTHIEKGFGRKISIFYPIRSLHSTFSF